MKCLIVNADDFGFTPGVCEGILQAHRKGVVTSTTILINAPPLSSYLEKLKQCETLDLGLHLNVTWGTPISPLSHVASLVSAEGRFIRRGPDDGFEGVNFEEVALEWRAQILKARSLNLNLSHLDTHHHAHMHPALLDIIAEIAKEEKLAVRSQASWIRDFLRANSIPTPDYFIVDFYGDGKNSLEHLQNSLNLIPPGTTEVCCHPAVVDEALKKISSYNEPRAGEFATLTNPALKQWLSENKIQLSNFKKLPKPAKAPDKSCDLIGDS